MEKLQTMLTTKVRNDATTERLSLPAVLLCGLSSAPHTLWEWPDEDGRSEPHSLPLHSQEGGGLNPDLAEKFLLLAMG